MKHHHVLPILVSVIAAALLAGCNDPGAPVAPADAEPGATCPYENDGQCDVDLGICPTGTDVADCAPEDPQPPTSLPGADLPCMDRDSPAAVGDCIAECLTLNVVRGAYNRPEPFSGRPSRQWLFEIEAVNSCDVGLRATNTLVTVPPDYAALWEEWYRGRSLEFDHYYEQIDGTWWSSIRGGDFQLLIRPNETKRILKGWIEYPHPHNGTPSDSFRMRWCTWPANYLEEEEEGTRIVNHWPEYEEALNARFGPSEYGPSVHVSAWCNDLEAHRRKPRDSPYIDGVHVRFRDGVIYDGGNHRELTVHRE